MKRFTLHSLFFCFLLQLVTTACTDLDDVYSRLDDLEDEVSGLNVTVSSLNETINVIDNFLKTGSILVSISPIETEQSSGYTLNFSDGSCVTVLNQIITGYEIDDENGYCEIIFTNGDKVRFPTHHVEITGIVILQTDALNLDWKGSAEIIFRVNPSNATFNYDVDSPNCEIVIDQVRTRSNSYVTAPIGYCLESIDQVKDDEGNPVQGQYKATVKDLAKLSGYDTDAVLVVSSKNTEDILTELSSNPVKICSSYNYVPVKTGIPAIVIDTPEGAPIVSKDDWMADARMMVFSSEGILDFEGPLSVKGRGNSTWGCPKKPYALKLDKKNSILGLPKHKRWVLLADYYDISATRNHLAFAIGNELSHLDWTPHTIPVSVTLNGEYQGLYTFTEQIKIDENRVNVGDDGFVMEIDGRAANPDETDPFFYVPHIGAPVAVKDYDEKEESFEYIKEFVNRADELLFSDNFTDSKTGWSTMFDLESFAEWYLIQEISKNADSEFFSSCYMNLTKGGKLKMGPLWDFDLAFGNYWGTVSYNDPEGFHIKNVLWFSRMFQDPAFVSLVKARYSEYYANKDRILSMIDGIENKSELAFRSDYVIWRDTSLSLSDIIINSIRKEQTDNLKTWISTRMDWLKSAIDEL